MKKIIISECSNQFWPEVFNLLKNENGWEPVYWTLSSTYIEFEIIKKYFPKVILHENYDAVRGIPVKEFNKYNLNPIDSILIKDFAIHESIVLKMMDRMDPIGQFNYSDRLRLYHYYIKYWSNILDILAPDIFIAPVSPHLCYDYILYQLCRNRGIKCILFIETSLPYTIYLNEAFELNPKKLLERYNHLLLDLNTPKLSLKTQIYFNKISNYSYKNAIPDYMIEQYNNEKINILKQKSINRGISILYSFIRYIKHILFDNWHNKQTNTYYKSKDTNIEIGTLTQLEFKKYSKVMTKRTNALKEKYHSLTTEPNFAKPYIFLGLMYQPERTSSPDGGIFTNQYLMIEWLSANIPEDWILYVKEHPSQFMFHIDQTRNEWLYEDLIKLPNVKLISTSTDTFQLIDNSMAIATLTGTVGFESIARSKPALCFGYSWYRACEGVFTINTIRDLKSAIATILDGYIPDKNKILKYIQAIEEIGINCYVDPHYEKGFDVNKNIRNIKNAIIQFVEEIN